MTGTPAGDPAKQVRDLEYRVETLGARNARLAQLLKDSRDQLALLREEVTRLGTPPSTYGVLLGVHTPDDPTEPTVAVDVHTAGRRMMLTLSPTIDVRRLRIGQSVRLNEALTVVELLGHERLGETCSLREVLEDGRALVTTPSDDERVVLLAAILADAVGPEQPRPGDTLLVDTKAGVAFERIPKAEVESLVLEEVPDVDYGDIGGLGPQIDMIRDAVELPFLHGDLYREYALRPPKGVLLYGPPGCGKTLIAKAVANSLARKIAEARGADPDVARQARSFFLNIKGPELLNKYVGETERHIRLIFERAREKASAGMPVIVFFDEMDSIFRTRGSGVSSDVETTIVPQLLAEIDGVEGLENVIVIGASNREDMIDPAILRPGRLDVKIRIQRPDAVAAREILAKYLTVDVPLDPEDLAAHGGDRAACVAALVDGVVARMYSTSARNRFLEITYATGDKEVLYFKDFASGAMIANIVDRAKKAAIKRVLETGSGGIGHRNLDAAVTAEFAENEDLPNTSNPDEWARISGRKGDRVVYLRVLAGNADATERASAATDAAPSIGPEARPGLVGSPADTAADVRTIDPGTVL